MDFPLRGRQAEARRNDARILEAALEVFAEDPAAPMSAVASRAGVGQASLYRRYPTKDTLLAEVCEQAMARMGQAARQALPDGDLAGFLRWYIDSGTLRLPGLLGTFTPPEHLYTLAHEVNLTMQQLVEATSGARPDVTGADLTLIATQIGSLDTGEPERTRQLQQRYLTLALQGLLLTEAEPLPGPAPDADELEAPWQALRNQS